MVLIILIVVLAIFTIASILYQIKKLQPSVQKIDKFNLLPNYSFFAPRPLSTDYRIAFTVNSKENKEWVEVPMYKDFNVFRFIWNPFKYYNKGFIDSCQFLLQEYQALDEKKFIQISLYYLNFLTIISKVIKPKEENQQIRYVLMNSNGIKTISLEKVVFASFNQII